MKFIKCPQCDGKGSIQAKICKKCKGKGVYSWYGGYFIYFSKVFKKGQVWAIRIRNILNALVKIVFIIIGITGAIFLLKFLIDSLSIFPEFAKNLFEFIPYQNNFLINFFWFSLLIDMFFYYKKEREQDRQIKNWPKTSTEMKNKVNSWQDIK